MLKRTRVLIVEDEIASISRLYIGLLRMDFTVEVCDNPSELQQRLARFKPQIVVISQKLHQTSPGTREKFSIPVIQLGIEGNVPADADLALDRMASLSTIAKAIENIVAGSK
jgi:ActR/RegA family two-component response regulator